MSNLLGRAVGADVELVALAMVGLGQVGSGPKTTPKNLSQKTDVFSTTAPLCRCE